MIRFENITKRFGGVTALDDVSLDIAAGEVHALIGENGAGKSTLGKILAGIHRPDTGRVLIDDAPADLRSPRDATAAGVAMVHQELAFCPDLSVAENVALGHLPRRWGGFVNRGAMRRQANTLLGDIGVTPDQLDVRRRMGELSTAQHQLVQIAKALGQGARVIVFDEPTSSLGEAETGHLFDLIGRLRQRGVTMIYVSHRMPEVFVLADRLSVLRDGRHVGTLSREEATEDAVVRLMVGRSVEAHTPSHTEHAVGDVILRVEGLTSSGLFEDVRFAVRAGEIVGMAGLVGSGRSEIARAVFGLEPRTGVVEIAGVPLPRSTHAAIAAGIGMVPEDRKHQGLVLDQSCRWNYSSATLGRFSRAGFVNRSAERQAARSALDELSTKTAGPEAPASSLSGGNQQKVVLAKWLALRDTAAGLKLLIVDEPTRGVDVGAKAAIHRLLDDLAARGLAILLISSELPEVLNLSSRVLVMRDGRIAAELPRDEADQETVLRHMGVGIPVTAT